MLNKVSFFLKFIQKKTLFFNADLNHKKYQFLLMSIRKYQPAAAAGSRLIKPTQTYGHHHYPRVGCKRTPKIFFLHSNLLAPISERRTCQPARRCSRENAVFFFSLLRWIVGAFFMEIVDFCINDLSRKTAKNVKISHCENRGPVMTKNVDTVSFNNLTTIGFPLRFIRKLI